MIKKVYLSRKNVLQKAITKYGPRHQTDKCIEECAELTVALLKLRQVCTQENHEKCIQDILGEIADVQIMLDQMRMIYGDTTQEENYKVKRLEEWLRS